MREGELLRNHEHYIDRMAGEAIRKVCACVQRRKQHRPWGDRLTYRIEEVMRPEMRITY